MLSSRSPTHFEANDRHGRTGTCMSLAFVGLWSVFGGAIGLGGGILAHHHVKAPKGRSGYVLSAVVATAILFAILAVRFGAHFNLLPAAWSRLPECRWALWISSIADYRRRCSFPVGLVSP